MKFLSIALLAFLVFPLVACRIEKEDREPTLIEENIQLLTQLQQIQLEHAQLLRNGTIIGIFLLVLALVLVLGYSRYRLKLKSTHLLESKQHEINQKNHSLEQLLNE